MKPTQNSAKHKATCKLHVLRCQLCKHSYNTNLPRDPSQHPHIPALLWEGGFNPDLTTVVITSWCQSFVVEKITPNQVSWTAPQHRMHKNNLQRPNTWTEGKLWLRDVTSLFAMLLCPIFPPFFVCKSFSSRFSLLNFEALFVYKRNSALKLINS